MRSRMVALLLGFAHVVAATTPCLFPVVPRLTYVEGTSRVILPPGDDVPSSRA